LIRNTLTVNKVMLVQRLLGALRREPQTTSQL